MNLSLNTFENSKNVWHIGGWQYPIGFGKSGPKFLFYRLMNCWGWGTWKDRWQHYEKNPKKLINLFNSKLIHEFNYDNSQNFSIK